MHTHTCTHANTRKHTQTHIQVLVLALVHMLPLTPFSWSRRSYRLLMQLSLVGQGYKLFLRHGRPSFK
jgi:hypothetical protein